MNQETFILTASHIVYFHVCHRKLWLFSKGIELEHFSESVLEGRQIHQSTYSRRPSKYVEFQLDGIKIDFFDPQTRTVHETKRGRAIEKAHRAQVQYYLFKLHHHGVIGACGLIEYPDLRRTESVAPLTDENMAEIAGWEQSVRQIIQREVCPTVINKPFCRQCAYYDFCYVSDIE